VVVVVSEERGTVSMVREGSIKEITGPERLSVNLERLLEGEQKKEKSNGVLRKLGKDAGVKIGFVLLAIFIWFFFAGEKESLISFTTPIEFRNFPRNYELLSISADRAEVQISGSRRLLLQLKPDQIGLSLNMEEIKPGKNTFVLTRKNLSMPPGFDVVKIYPNELTVAMEEKKTKPLLVEPQWTGDLPEGKKLLSHKVLPESIVVIGTPPVLKELTSIKTEPIDLSSITGTETVEVNLVISGTAVRLSPDAPRKVKVSLEIGQEKESEKKKKVNP
jgi:YbbR domain-containing protein